MHTASTAPPRLDAQAAVAVTVFGGDPRVGPTEMSKCRGQVRLDVDANDNDKIDDNE